MIIEMKDWICSQMYHSITDKNEENSIAILKIKTIF